MTKANPTGLDMCMGSLSIPGTKFTIFWTTLVSFIVHQQIEKRLNILMSNNAQECVLLMAP